MNLKENCKYIFNKKNQVQSTKNHPNSAQTHNSKYTQTQACSVLFEISNTQTLQPLDRDVRYTELKKNVCYSPWREFKHYAGLGTEQKAKKDYLSMNKKIDNYKKHKGDPSMKTLSELIQFPIREDFKLEKYNKRRSYFQKCKTKEENPKYSQNEYLQPNYSLGKLTKTQSKSVQVLHLKKHEDNPCVGSNQRSVIMLPNYKFIDYKSFSKESSKLNITKQNFKMSLIKKRLKKRVRKSQGKELYPRQNMNVTFESMLKQRFRTGVLNIKEIEMEWKNKISCKNQNTLYRFVGERASASRVK